VSPKYQVVIPREARKALGIQPGQQVQVLVYEGRVEFVPVKKLKKMRGSLRGIDTSIPRDKDRV
jgi:AbrB family looped-hinge helix DNA binding protein